MLSSMRLLTDQNNHDQPFNLTDIQYAYWIGRQKVYTGGNVPCHVYFETDFRDLDVPQLEKAINLMTKRHGMLRAIVTEDTSL